MKKRNILMLSLLTFASLGVMTSCVQVTPTNEQPGQTENQNITVSISGPTLVNVGETITLSATVTNDVNRLGVTWTSSDTNVATIEGGVVTGVGAGTTEITATSREDENAKASIQINVVEVEEVGLTVSASNYTPTIGEVVTLTVGLNTTSIPRVFWESQNQLGALISTGDPSSIQYNPRSLGTDIITAEIYVGNYSYKEQIIITVKEGNYVNYQEINSVEAFMDFFNTQATTRVNGNYCLTADIDLQGAELDCSNFAGNAGLGGIFDGRGHAIKNYKLVGHDASGANKQVGLFNGIASGAAVRNTHFIGEIPEEGTAWGSGGVTTGCDGLIDNCLVEISHTYDTSLDIDENGYFPFCSAISGTFNGKIVNVVVNSNIEAAGYATMYADVAYPTGFGGFGTQQTFAIDYLYTNSTVVGGQQWDWGGMVLDMTTYRTGLDFAQTSASTYSTLPSDIWNLTDGAMPTLKTF